MKKYSELRLWREIMVERAPFLIQEAYVVGLGAAVHGRSHFYQRILIKKTLVPHNGNPPSSHRGATKEPPGSHRGSQFRDPMRPVPLKEDLND